MNKFIKYITIIVAGVISAAFYAGCSDDIDPLITSLDTSRLFSPVNLEATVFNQTSVRLKWLEVKQAKSYNIEFFVDEENAPATPIKTIAGLTFIETPYIVSGFEGETNYLVRIQATGDGIDPSKWISARFKTGSEQIFLPVDPDEIQANQITLHWPAGATATEIVMSPNDIRHSLTAEEIATGAATITGLTGETTYTAKLMNGTKTRGTISFTTLIDLGGATAIYPGDDLKAILDAAEEGAAFVIFPGEYTLDSYAVTKSLKLSGYKANDKPVIYGQFKCATPVSFLELKMLIVRGNANPSSMVGQFFNTQTDCNLGALTITDCEISNYSNNFIYNNTTGVIGNIRISGCLINNIAGTGGDGFDFRNGSLSSLTVENSTFADGFRTFLRMQLPCAVSFKHCTFYKVSCLDDGNNHGLFRCSGGGTLEVRNCLFVETGKENPANATAGNWCRNANNMTAVPTYSQNYYYNCPNLWVGLYTNPADCNAMEANPGFRDAAHGDYTLTNMDLINVAGDPRWW